MVSRGSLEEFGRRGAQLTASCWADGTAPGPRIIRLPQFAPVLPPGLRPTRLSSPCLVPELMPGGSFFLLWLTCASSRQCLLPWGCGGRGLLLPQAQRLSITPAPWGRITWAVSGWREKEGGVALGRMQRGACGASMARGQGGVIGTPSPIFPWLFSFSRCYPAVPASRTLARRRNYGLIA